MISGLQQSPKPRRSRRWASGDSGHRRAPTLNSPGFELPTSGNYAFSPSTLPGLNVWLTAGKGITAATSPTVSSGTSPPAATITGTPSATLVAGTTPANPMVSCVIALTGILGTATFTWTINGVSQGSLTTATTVTLGTTGLTFNCPAGTYTLGDTYNVYASVSALTDQSGLGNNVSQLTSSKQPFYFASGTTGYGSSANLPVLNFVAANVQNMTNGTLALAQPCTVYCVGNQPAPNTSGFNDFSSAVPILYGIVSTNNLGMYAGTGVPGPTTVVTSPCVMSGVFTGVSSVGYVNSSGGGASNSPGTNGFVSGYAIGGGINITNAMTGNLAAFLIYSGAHSAAVVSQVFQYFGALYGHAWS